MKKYLSAIVLCVLLCSAAQAAHIIGGQLSYECKGDGKYEIIMKLYRDCNGGGAGFDSSPLNIVGQVSIYQGTDTKLFQSIELNAPQVTLVEPDLTHLCGAAPPDVCVEEGIYRFKLNLPLDEESYHIVYQRCCRNSTITNIDDPGSSGATYRIEITPEAQIWCNNSAVFNEYPPVIICANQSLNYDHSASDLDGDSLVYSFCAPLLGGTLGNVAPNPDSPPPFSPVVMIEPNYTVMEPMGGNPLVSIDPQTGLISGTPTIQGQFVVGVCAREYRNGKFVGSIQRDFQFNVAACSAPVVAELDGDSEDGIHFFYESCEGEMLTMTNQSYNEADISSYFWTMDFGGVQALTFDKRDFTLPFPNTGTYRGMMLLNRDLSCSDTAFIEVLVHPNPSTALHFDFDPCEHGPVQFTSIQPLDQSPIENWNWDFGDGGQSPQEYPQHQYLSEGMYEVELLFADENGCKGISNMELLYELEPPLQLLIDSAAGCLPLRVSFDQLTHQLDSTYQINWDFGDGTTSEAIAPIHLYESIGKFDVGLEIISPLACLHYANFPDWIEVAPPPLAQFTYAPEEVFKLQEIQFQDLSEEANTWQWRFGQSDIVEDQHPKWIFTERGIQEVRLLVEDQYGCQDSSWQELEVIPVFHVYVPNAFSPNDDGNNDEFRAYASCPLASFQMKIYDRWGQLIFESKDIEQSWDGYLMDEVYNTGVFTWWIRYLEESGEREKVLKGDLTLMR